MTPHFSYPFRLSGSSFATVEQDTDEDVDKSLTVLVLTPVGSREELPQYGVPPILFAQEPLPVAAIQAAINRWEPRASTLLTSFGDRIDPKIQTLLAQVRPQ